MKAEDGRPDDVPEDVWEAAKAALLRGNTKARMLAKETDPMGVLSDAILTRQEAILALIDSHAEGERALQHAAREAKDRRDTLIHMYCAQGLKSLSTAIRTGGKP